MLYNGMFYITGSDKWYMDPETGIDWLFLVIIFIPSIMFLLAWLNAIKTQFLIILYMKSTNCFKLVTLNLMDMNKFKAEHIDPQFVNENLKLPADDDLSHLTPRGTHKKSGSKTPGKSQVDEKGNAIYDGSQEGISGIDIDSDDPDPLKRKFKKMLDM